MGALWRTDFDRQGDAHLARGSGLQLFEVTDLLTGRPAANYWIVALKNSGETLLVLHASERRAKEIASGFAEMRDWTCVWDWDGTDLLPEQIEASTRYAGEAMPPLLRRNYDWDDIVPYGPTH